MLCLNVQLCLISLDYNVLVIKHVDICVCVHQCSIYCQSTEMIQEHIDMYCAQYAVE